MYTKAPYAFYWPLFFKERTLFTQFSEMQKLFRILANKSNRFNFEGNTHNCEILNPSNPYRYMHTLTRMYAVSGKVMTDQQCSEFNRMSETHN